MYGYIYLTTNLVNGMIYVGQHKSKEFTEKYFGSGINIKRAIKKYGKDNFSVKLLEWCETQNDADCKERYLLKKYNLPNSNIGYNITKGGQSKFFTDCKHTDESKEKMSRAAIKREHPPTTAGRICYTDGTNNKLIKPDEIPYYESLSWYRGKTTSGKPAWNKGLTKETDERVAKYTDSRNKHFENGESIGCFGVKGNTNGFVKGMTPWNKGLFGYNNGHPNYYHGKDNKNKK